MGNKPSTSNESNQSSFESVSTASISKYRDIHPSTEFSRTYTDHANFKMYPSFLSMWHYYIRAQYDGKIEAFTDDIYKVFSELYNIDKDIYKLILEFAIISLENNKDRIENKQNILKTLYCTSEAHGHKEFATDALSPIDNCKWFTGGYHSPMLLFKFTKPISIHSCFIKSANDCPFRDPYHFILFGMENDSIKDSNKIIILHEYNEDKIKDENEKLWSKDERWKIERFQIDHDIIDKKYMFRFIGLKIFRGEKDKHAIQIGQIDFSLIDMS